jgi:hypothetical protein
MGPQGEALAGEGASKLPRGAWHGFRNASGAPPRMLVLLSPGVQGLEMFRHFGRAGRSGPLAPEDIVGIAAQHGVRFV